MENKLEIIFTQIILIWFGLLIENRVKQNFASKKSYYQTCEDLAKYAFNFSSCSFRNIEVNSNTWTMYCIIMYASIMRIS